MDYFIETEGGKRELALRIAALGYSMKNELESGKHYDMVHGIRNYSVARSDKEVDLIRGEVAIINAAIARLKSHGFTDKSCATVAFEIWATIEDTMHDSSIDGLITSEEERDILKERKDA